MNLLFWMILVLSILCLLYFFVIIAYAGSCASFSDFWLTSALVGIFMCIIIKFIVLYDVHIPRLCVVLFVFILVAGILLFGIIEGMLIYHSRKRKLPHMDYIIILGAQVRGTTISKALIKRLDTAIVYLNSNPETVVIVSGGKGEDEALSEAEAMKQYLVDREIASNRIIKEDKSRNTFENICYSKPLIKEGSTVAIVTNGFHIYRSVRLARKQGLSEVKGLAAPMDSVLRVNYYVREAVGVMKDLLEGNM